MTTVQTLYGTFNEEELETLKNSIDEINVCMSKMDVEKQNIKGILDATFDRLSIPKKIIRKMAKVKYKQTFQEEVAEQKEFEALFEGIEQ